MRLWRRREQPITIGDIESVAEVVAWALLAHDGVDEAIDGLADAGLRVRDIEQGPEAVAALVRGIRLGEERVRRLGLS